MSAFKKHPYYCTFLAIVLMLSILGMTGCASPQDNARTLLDRVEFEADEYGSFEVEGNIDLSSVPFISATVHVRLEKFKDKPGQVEEVAP